ncbi:universal stress protein [Brachybacterium sp. AOP25-B2-12]|uniref:universal stress protein n=1 Tax=Brachybacterium sp. AOP25-B2-12 TaxID=3457710 RepID=UPI00403378EC
MTVVVGFIPTSVGFAALDAAREEAELRGGPLIIVNVVREGDAEDPRHAGPGQIDQAHERTHRASVRVDVRQISAEHDIADALLKVVEDEKAELLVIGIRREREFARHLLGTTAQKLLLASRCEVLVV